MCSIAFTVVLFDQSIAADTELLGCAAAVNTIQRLYQEVCYFRPLSEGWSSFALFHKACKDDTAVQNMAFGKTVSQDADVFPAWDVKESPKWYSDLSAAVDSFCLEYLQRFVNDHPSTYPKLLNLPDINGETVSSKEKEPTVDKFNMLAG